MRVIGEVVLGGGVEVSEVTTPAAGDADFLADLFGVIEEEGFASSLCGSHCAH